MGIDQHLRVRTVAPLSDSEIETLTLEINDRFYRGQELGELIERTPNKFCQHELTIFGMPGNGRLYTSTYTHGSSVWYIALGEFILWRLPGSTVMHGSDMDCYEDAFDTDPFVACDESGHRAMMETFFRLGHDVVSAKP